MININKDEILPYSEEETAKRRKPMNNLKLITGGKGGSHGSDWLTPLPLDTIFLCKSTMQTQNFMVLRFRVDYRYDSNMVSLYDNTTEMPWGIVDPVRFCANFSLVEVLALPTQETEQDDGESNRNASDTAGEVDQLGDDDPASGLDGHVKGS